MFVESDFFFYLKNSDFNEDDNYVQKDQSEEEEINYSQLLEGKVFSRLARSTFTRSVVQSLENLVQSEAAK